MPAPSGRPEPVRRFAGQQAGQRFRVAHVRPVSRRKRDVLRRHRRDVHQKLPLRLLRRQAADRAPVARRLPDGGAPAPAGAGEHCDVRGVLQVLGGVAVDGRLRRGRVHVHAFDGDVHVHFEPHIH